MLLTSLLLTILSVFLVNKNSKYFIFLFSFLVLAILWITGFYFVSDMLTGNGIDESILYHLHMGLEGAGFVEFKNIIFFSSIYLFATFFFTLFIYKFPNYVKYKKISLISIIVILYSYSINPGVKDLYSLLTSTKISASEAYRYPSHYISEIDIDFHDIKKNIVFIYLESLESTYLDSTLFPDLLPNISNLKKSGLSFNNIDQLWGTSWTMGGMVASQCGIPLVTPSHGNSMSGTDVFLPNVLCLGDILKNNNYNLLYLGGANLKFAGKEKFLKSHGFNKIFGLEELSHYLDNENYISSWGIFDDTLFSLATKKFDYLSNLKKPFGLFMLTLDTHHPSGHISMTCSDYIYKHNESNQILNAVHCADKLVYNFVKYIKNSDIYNDTIIILLSDHLAMRNTAWDQLKSGNRKNLFIIIGKDIKPKIVDKPGSLFDVTPTVLKTMGTYIDGLGFGRNLLSETPTFVQIKDNPNKYLQENRNFFMSLWNFPKVNSNIFFNTEENSVLIGRRLYEYPALFLLDDNLHITEARFEFFYEHRHHRLHNQILSLGFDQNFIWIDRCKYISRLLSDESYQDNTFCAYFGALGKHKFKNYRLNEIQIAKFSTIKNLFDNIEVSEIKHKRRLTSQQKNNFNFGIRNVIIHESGESELEGDFVLV